MVTSAEPAIAQKDQLRSQFRTRRQRFVQSHQSQLPTLVEALTQRLQQVLPSEGPIAGYRAMGSEVNLDGFFEAHKDRQWCYPKVEAEELQFYHVEDWQNFGKSSWGVWEPLSVGGRALEKRELVAVVVPGLAFDTQGHRLGYGKGFYDRALDGYSGVKIGVAFSVQVSQEMFAVEGHDVPMDFVITETETLEI